MLNQLLSAINKSLKEKNAANIKAECGESLTQRFLHDHNVKTNAEKATERRKRDTPETFLAFHIKPG